MNSVTLIGRLVADPDYYTGISKNGKDYQRTTFTLAVNRERDDTDFIRVVVFGRQAESTAKYLKKGSKAGVLGTLKSGKYTNKEGRTVNTLDVNATFIEFLDSRTSNSRDGGVNRYDDGGFDASQAFEPFDGDIMF